MYNIYKMSLNNRKWVIIPSCFVTSVNFNQILENNKNTLRYSLDGSKTFIKYDTEMPCCLSNITCFCNNCGCSEDSWCMTGITELNHSEILNILATEEWTDYNNVY